MRYDIDYKKLAILLTPILLRKERLLSFLYVLVSPVQRVARLFDTYREDTDYRLHHNGQVCYLRAVLNDQFDATLRRIRIEDVPELEGNIIYKRSISRFLMIPERPLAKVINRRGFGGTDGFDFAIIIPLALRGTIDENRLRAIVNKYRIASKRFTIIYQ